MERNGSRRFPAPKKLKCAEKLDEGPHSWALLAEEWAQRNRKIIGHLKKTRVSEP
jgi:hypothetical protein